MLRFGCSSATRLAFFGDAMNPATTGTYESTSLVGEGVRAVIPDRLPPHAALGFSGAARFDRGLFTLGWLHGIFAFAPGSS